MKDGSYTSNHLRFSAESFIRADTSLRNSSASARQGGRWEAFGRGGLHQLRCLCGSEPPASRVLGTGLGCCFAQLQSRVLVYHDDDKCHDMTSQAMAGTRPQHLPLSLLPCWPGQSSFPAGLSPRRSCYFGCDRKVPELLITSSSLALPSNARNISKN